MAPLQWKRFLRFPVPAEALPVLPPFRLYLPYNRPGGGSSEGLRT